MRFAVGQNICICVEPSDSTVEDIDTGTVAALIPPTEYDVDRDNTRRRTRHAEEHLFVLERGEKKKRRFQHGGYYAIVTWARPIDQHSCEVKFYMNSGTRIK